MRTHLPSVLVGGLLVAVGFILGSLSPARVSDAGVATDARRELIYTSGDDPSCLFYWRPDRAGVGFQSATKYIASQGKITSENYFPVDGDGKK